MDVLRQVPMFSGLSDKQFKVLNSLRVEKHYQKRRVIFTPNDIAEGFYILKSGRVKIYKSRFGKEQVIKVLSKPDIFGEAAGFSGTNFPVWAEAMEKSVIYFIPRTEFIRFLREDVDTVINLLSVMADRLVYLTLLIENLSLRDSLSRLAFFLLSESKKLSSNRIVFNNGLVASALGLTSETVSRTVSRLKDIGAIEKSGNIVVIKNYEILRKISR